MVALIAAYRSLVAEARARAAPDDSSLDPAIAAFEPLFYGNMVRALDG